MKTRMWFALMFLPAVWLPAAEPAAGRILQFPPDRCLGILYLQDENTVCEIEDFYHWINNAAWEDYSKALGPVVIPEGKRVRLVISRGAWGDLSPLEQLKPDDLYSVALPAAMDAGKRANDRCMPYIGHLTGLKHLGLKWTDVSNVGLRHIEGLTELEYLELPDKISNEALFTICKLHSLKGLYFGDNGVKNVALSKLTQLKNLQELELGGRLLDNGCLQYIAQIPSLEYLFLFGNFKAGKEWEELSKLPHLKILNLGRIPIDDATALEISKISALENLSLYGTPVTDRGISYLRNLKSLKKLDLAGTENLTRQSISYLQEIGSLRLLHLPNEIVTDREMIYLGRLTNLEDLAIPNVNYVNKNRYSLDKHYTGSALKELVPLQKLKKLHLGGYFIRDEGLQALRQLPRLEDLTLFGCPVTQEGLIKICEIKTLKKLYLDEPNLILSDLQILNHLPLLTEFRAYPLRRTAVCTLDLSGLKNLESIDIGLERDQAFTGRDFASLKDLKTLKSLYIRPMDIDNETVRFIAENLPNIERISLASDRLTDEAAEALVGLKHLEHLGLRGSNLTDKTLGRLCWMERLRFASLTSDQTFSPQAVQKVHELKPDLYLEIKPPKKKDK